MAALHHVGHHNPLGADGVSYYRRILDLRPRGRRHVDAEMDREIDAHIQLRVDDLVREGMSPTAARAEAERRFGDFGEARQALHSAARQRAQTLRQRDLLGALAVDAKFALRQVRSSPGFASLVIATLAIGIGLTTAMFTLVERVLLRPLPFPHAEQLVALGSMDSLRQPIVVVSSADWQDWKREAKSLQSTAIYSLEGRMGIADADSATRVSARETSGNFFQTLGARFAVGRPFTEEEAQAQTPVVVVSEALWRRMLGADRSLSKPIRVGSRSYAVVGVVANGFDFPAGTEIWFADTFRPESGGMRNNINWLAIARLKAGVTRAAAAAELGAVARRIRTRDPVALYSYGVDVKSLGTTVVGGVARYLQLLMASVGFVLLIVCANVASATLGRGMVRAREMAVRASLGAGRGRLIRQLLIEHVMLALIGGAIGLALAWAGIRVLLDTWGSEIPRADEVRLDGAVFAFAFGVSLMVGIVSGLLPALRGSRVSLRGLMASGGRTMAGGRNLPGTLLASAEIALALLLLTGAALLIRSFQTLLGRNLGFDTHVATAQMVVSGARYRGDPARRTAYWDEIARAYRAIPGVTAVGISNWVPLAAGGATFIELAGRDGANAGAGYRVVGEDYFRAMQIPLVAGRAFGAEDGPSTQRVVVINRRMAETYWRGRNPIGQLVKATSMESAGGATAPWLTIVGIVGDIRHWGLEGEIGPEMYVLFRQVPSFTTSMTVVVRSSAAGSRIRQEMRIRARSVDPLIAADVGTLDTKLDALLAPRRLTMSLLTGFALLALLLAALGVYGVISYAVAQRSRELAVRAALGAQRAQLLMLVMRDAARFVGLGMAAGLMCMAWLSRTMSAMLIDVSPLDPASYAMAVLLLALVAAVAVLVPARRATRLDPMIALQAE